MVMTWAREIADGGPPRLQKKLIERYA